MSELAIGIKTVVVTGGAALPALAGLFAGTVSAGTAIVTLGTAATFAFGSADMMEAFQDLRYGMWGSSKTSFNPLRDTMFAGNEDLYYGLEMAATLLASAGTATFRSFNMESEINASEIARYEKNIAFESGSKTEVFYRTMSQSDYDYLRVTGELPPTKEAFISPTKSYSSDYDGVMVKFELNGGTTSKLEKKAYQMAIEQG